MNYIKGINKFHQYQYNNVNYYFLGDIHKKLPDPCPQIQPCDHMINNFTELLKYNNHCSNITALIYQWLSFNYDNQINTDFFIEYPIKTNKIDIINYDNNNGNESYSNKGFMVDTMMMLKDCLEGNCLYNPIIKIHRADPRNVITDKNYVSSPFILDDIEKFFIAGKNVMLKKDITSNVVKNLDEFIKVVYFLIENSNQLLKIALYNGSFSNYITTLLKKLKTIIPEQSIIFGKIVNLFDKMLLLTKHEHEYIIATQLSKISPEIKNKIINYTVFKNQQYIKKLTGSLFNENYDVNEYSIEENVKTIKNWNKTIEDYDNILIAINNIVTKLVLLSSIYMDTYILARMFKYDSGEVIVYTGGRHIEFFDDFFAQIGKSVIYSDSDNMCIKTKSKKIDDLLK